MKETKKEKFMDEIVGCVNSGVPGCFGISLNEGGTGYNMFSQNSIYAVLRLEARIRDQRGQVFTFNQRSTYFFCGLRQGAGKQKKTAFFIADQEGRYRCSSKEDWVEADIYVLAVPARAKRDTPDMPLALWGRFRRHGELDVSDIPLKNHLIAVSTDPNLVRLLDALADDTFPLRTAEEVTDDE